MSSAMGTWGSHPVHLPDNTVEQLPIRRRQKCGSYFVMLDRRRQTVTRNPDGTFTLKQCPLVRRRSAS